MVTPEEVDRVLSQCVDELEKYAGIRAWETVSRAKDTLTRLRRDAQGLSRWRASVLLEDLRVLINTVEDAARKARLALNSVGPPQIIDCDRPE
jgi:hypothetical protein